MLDRPRLWIFLAQLVGTGPDEVDAGFDSGLRCLATRLQKGRPDAKRLLMKLGDRGEGPFERDEFLDALRSAPGSRALLVGRDRPCASASSKAAANVCEALPTAVTAGPPRSIDLERFQRVANRCYSLPTGRRRFLIHWSGVRIPPGVPENMLDRETRRGSGYLPGTSPGTSI